MLETYPGILRADRIEWTGEAPDLATGQAVRVHITLLEQPTPPTVAEQGRKMAEALERLAAHSSSGLPEDPATWQREERVDRPLPGRAE